MEQVSARGKGQGTGKEVDGAARSRRKVTPRALNSSFSGTLIGRRAYAPPMDTASPDPYGEASWP